MNKLIIALLFVSVSVLVFSGEPIRLDTLSGVKITCNNMVESEGGWRTEKSIKGAADVSVDIVFPKVYTVNKIVFDLGEYSVNRGFDVRKYPGLYNFEIICKDATYGGFKTVRTYTNNSYYKLEVKEKFKTDTLRIKMNSSLEGMSYYWGGIARMQVFGFEGEEVKKSTEKIVIKTKADAKQALKNGEISAKEYVDYLKKFKE